MMSCRLPSHSFCWIVVCSETSAPAAATASIITSTTNKCGLKQAQAAAKRYDRSARSKAKPTGRRTRSRARRAAICGTSSRSRRGTVASKGRTSRSAARRLPSASLPPTARRRGRANWRRFGIAGGWWSRRRGRHLPLRDCEGARTAAGAREAALQAKCWAGGWGGHYRIIAFRLLSGPIIALGGKGSGAQKSTCIRSMQVGLAAPATTILNALSRVWISASLDATIGKHVQSRRASLVLGGPARPSNDLQCFAVRFRCWLSPSFLLSGMLLAIGYATGACCDVAAP